MSFLPLLLFLALHALHLAASFVDQFTFDGFAGANLSLDGTAVVTADGLLMLTNGTTLLKGHSFYPSPLRLHEAVNGASAVRSFSTAFVFGIVSEYADISSPGLAFVVTKSSDFSTALQSQYMGLANAANNGNASNHFLAVELDTVINAEFGDMSNNHVGVDVNGLVSVVADSAGYYEDDTGAFRNMSLLNRTAAQVWVDFDARTSLVSVTMAPLEVPKPKKPLLSTTVNLSSVIEDEAYIGFSSSTGVVSSRHFVLAWSFKMDGQAPPLNTSKLPALPFTIPKRPSKTLKILLPIATAALVLALAIIVVVIDRRRRKYAEVKEDWETAFGPHRFSYKDLFDATNGFCDERLLGVGGFGSVYKGVLPVSGVEVAVKKVSHESRQGVKEFIAEVVSIGQIRHRNLVQLLGYCRRKRELLLVYDHMPNGSLDKFLYDHNSLVLSWSQRFGIIKDVASSILYLHEDWEQVVLHRDIKASNVLLDAEMNGRLGDFGLARLYDHGTDPHTTHVVGTMGYLAPELGHTGKASKASDIFAFGVFMLEVTCGRRPISQDAHGDHLLLVDAVLEHWREGTITDAVDPRLRGDFAVEEASLVLKLCLLCSQPMPSARPGIRQIMQFLDGNMPLPELSEAHLRVNMLSLMQKQSAGANLTPEMFLVEDSIAWRLTANGEYSASSAYRIQFAGSTLQTGSPNCYFCPLCIRDLETTEHLFVNCPVTKAIWECVSCRRGCASIAPSEWPPDANLDDLWFTLIGRWRSQREKESNLLSYCSPGKFGWNGTGASSMTPIYPWSIGFCGTGDGGPMASCCCHWPSDPYGD